jgi:hypothetical protein
MGDFLELEELNDNCSKTMPLRAMDKCFSVIHGFCCRTFLSLTQVCGD